MSIFKIINIAIDRSKNARAMQKRHPIVFNGLLAVLLLFFSPLILFNYISKKQWRL